jgi:TolB protein
MGLLRSACAESETSRLAGGAHQGDSLGPAEARRIVRRRLRSFLGGGFRSRLDASRIARKVITRSYAAGDVIIRKGVRGDFLGVVTQGQLVVVTPGAAAPGSGPGRDAREPLLIPGQSFGEWMLIDGEPSTSTVRACSDAEVAFLHRTDLLEVAGARATGSSAGRARRTRWWLLALLLFAASLTLVAVVQKGLLDSGPSDGRRALSDGPLLAEGVAIFISPKDGTILQHSDSMSVRVQVMEPGFFQAQLQVDGTDVGTQANGDPGATSWTVDWSWEGVSDGRHTLAVGLLGQEGEWFASTPVTVTVVPAGKILFSSNRDGAQAIYSMQTDGGRVQRLTTGPGDARQPAVRGDGSLAFVVESERGGEVIRWTGAGAEDARDLVAGRDPAWAPGGERVAYSSGVDGVSQISVSAVSGGDPVQVTAERAYAGQPAWSPDGTHLAYVAERDQNWDVWVVALDGSEPRRITNDPAMDWGPSWSPDGGSLAFVSDRMDGHQVYVARIDGSDLRRLTDLDQGAESPTWSPDGHWLTFVAYTGAGDGVHRREIYVMRSNGEDRVRLTYNAFDDTDPGWVVQR